MCNISDKLKLCTCSDVNTDHSHYWVLYRFVKGKKEMTVGEIIMPAHIEPETDTSNQNLLLTLLNTGNVFDEPVNAVNKDLLLLSFKTKKGDHINYGFLFRKGCWEGTKYDPFVWENKHEEIKTGEIINPLDF
jgi:hypothetical protein